MITIRKSYIGNSKEAFIEKRFSDGINILYSDENDKGKTIVMQSIMYALGNDPIFPGTFPYKNYYHIVDIEVDNKIISVCRKDHSFTVKFDGNVAIYDNLSEYKHFFNSNIYKLPVFVKDYKEKMTDLELFIQLFFVGQDNRDSSKIFNSGYYKKDDFMNMLYAMADCSVSDEKIDTDEIQQQIITLQSQRQKLTNIMEFSHTTIPESALVNYTTNKEAIDNKVSLLEQENAALTELKKDRARLFNRKTKNENLIRELNSLNKNLTEGSLKCLDCNSDHIGYENAGRNFTFDVSDIETRKDILHSIKVKIETLKEEICNIDRQISNKQDILKSLLEEEDISLTNLLFYKDTILNADEIDKQIADVDSKISKLQDMLKTRQADRTSNLTKQKLFFEAVIKDMNDFYKEVNPDGILVFDSLFTTKDKVHSGSEATIFFLSKLYSLAKNLNHSLPVVMDGFREGEISTDKENIILKKFSELPNQVVFTTTLKKQEAGKYDHLDTATKIDYSDKRTSHILNTGDLEKFVLKMQDFAIHL